MVQRRYLMVLIEGQEGRMEGRGWRLQSRLQFLGWAGAWRGGFHVRDTAVGGRGGEGTCGQTNNKNQWDTNGGGVRDYCHESSCHYIYVTVLRDGRDSRLRYERFGGFRRGITCPVNKKSGSGWCTMVLLVSDIRDIYPSQVRTMLCYRDIFLFHFNNMH